MPFGSRQASHVYFKSGETHCYVSEADEGAHLAPGSRDPLPYPSESGYGAHVFPGLRDASPSLPRSEHGDPASPSHPLLASPAARNQPCVPCATEGCREGEGLWGPGGQGSGPPCPSRFGVPAAGGPLPGLWEEASAEGLEPGPRVDEGTSLGCLGNPGKGVTSGSGGPEANPGVFTSIPGKGLTSGPGPPEANSGGLGLNHGEEWISAHGRPQPDYRVSTSVPGQGLVKSPGYQKANHGASTPEGPPYFTSGPGEDTTRLGREGSNAVSAGPCVDEDLEGRDAGSGVHLTAVGQGLKDWEHRGGRTGSQPPTVGLRGPASGLPGLDAPLILPGVSEDELDPEVVAALPADIRRELRLAYMANIGNASGLGRNSKAAKIGNAVGHGRNPKAGGNQGKRTRPAETLLQPSLKLKRSWWQPGGGR